MLHKKRRCCPCSAGRRRAMGDAANPESPPARLRRQPRPTRASRRLGSAGVQVIPARRGGRSQSKMRAAEKRVPLARTIPGSSGAGRRQGSSGVLKTPGRSPSKAATPTGRPRRGRSVVPTDASRGERPAAATMDKLGISTRPPAAVPRPAPRNIHVAPAVVPRLLLRPSPTPPVVFGPVLGLRESSSNGF